MFSFNCFAHIKFAFNQKLKILKRISQPRTNVELMTHSHELLNLTNLLCSHICWLRCAIACNLKWRMQCVHVIPLPSFDHFTTFWPKAQIVPCTPNGNFDFVCLLRRAPCSCSAQLQRENAFAAHHASMKSALPFLARSSCNAPLQLRCPAGKGTCFRTCIAPRND